MPPTRTCPAPPASPRARRRTAAPGPTPPPPARDARASARCTSPSPPRSPGGPSAQSSRDQPPGSHTTNSPGSPAGTVTAANSRCTTTLTLALPSHGQGSRTGKIAHGRPLRTISGPVTLQGSNSGGVRLRSFQRRACAGNFQAYAAQLVITTNSSEREQAHPDRMAARQRTDLRSGPPVPPSTKTRGKGRPVLSIYRLASTDRKRRGDPVTQQKQPYPEKGIAHDNARPAHTIDAMGTSPARARPGTLRLLPVADHFPRPL